MLSVEPLKVYDCGIEVIKIKSDSETGFLNRDLVIVPKLSQQPGFLAPDTRDRSLANSIKLDKKRKK